MVNIADALQRMHEAEKTGQVYILTIKPSFYFLFLFNIELGFVSLSTHFNTINSCQLDDTLNFLSTQ